MLTYSVYLVFDSLGMPMYVGCTTRMQTRKYEWKRELGVCPYGHVVLAEHLTYDTALAIESLYIKVIGRAPDGPLLNKVSYDNWQDVRSPETRAKIGRTGTKQPPASAQLRELRRANMLRIWKERREQRC